MTHVRPVLARPRLAFDAERFAPLSDCLLALQDATDIAAVMDVTLTGVREIIDCDVAAVGLCDPRNRYVVAQVWPDNTQLGEGLDVIRDFSHQSPMLRYWKRTGDHNRVLRLSDCAGLGFRDTALYSGYFRRHGFQRQAGTWCRPGGGHHLEIGLYRTGSLDFSEAELARLRLFREHVLRAYTRVLAGLIATPWRPGRTHLEMHPTAIARGIDPALPRAASLTPRETEVLRWIAEGKTNPEIGIILDMSPRTVGKHVEHLLEKLGVETRTAAAMRGMEWRLIDLVPQMS